MKSRRVKKRNRGRKEKSKEGTEQGPGGREEEKNRGRQEEQIAGREGNDGGREEK